jgi:uncharacterized membrane protein
MINLALILLTALNIFDIVSTWILIGTYGHAEANPIMAHLISQIGLCALLIKLPIILILVVLRKQLYNFRHLLYFATMVYLVCMIKYNLPMLASEIFF